MAVDIQFVDEVPARNTHSGRKVNPVFAEIAEALKGNPGANARVFIGVNTSPQAQFKSSRLKALGLVTATRVNPEGGFDVYAKFDGEPVAKAPTKPRAARKPVATPKAAPAVKKAAGPQTRKPRAKAAAVPDAE